MIDVPLAPAATVLVEPAFGRWHLRADCPVLLAQPDALVVAREAGADDARACTICVGNATPLE